MTKADHNNPLQSYHPSQSHVSHPPTFHCKTKPFILFPPLTPHSPTHSNSSYGWHFQYLTIIGLTLSTLTFILALTSDTLLSARLFYLKNILSLTSTPLSSLITLLYWSLRLIDPALVVPPEFELPLLPDLGFHLAPAAFSITDLLFLSPPWTIGVLPASCVSVALAVSYWVWIELCFARNGFYPYPLFEMLDAKGRVGVFGLSAALMVAATVVLRELYRWVNGVERQRQGQGMMRGKKGERPGKVKGTE